MSSISQVLLADIVHTARWRRASDVHLTPGESLVLRIDGRLEHLDGPPLAAADVACVAQSLIGEENALRAEAGEEISTAWASEDGSVIRAHVFRACGGLTVSLRLLERETPSLQTLNLPDGVGEFARHDRGLVIFAGPTGSGKSTSLAALVGEINASSARRIITIEDPIEYRHAGKRCSVTQREVGRDARSFESAIVGALRADPDVIVVGEMRDAATMRAALTAAETGHLVLTTLHTADAVQTIDRIGDAFAGEDRAQVRTQLALVLTGVVCQRLVRRSNGGGRVAAIEILTVTDAVRSLVRESRTHHIRNVMTTGRKLGMQTLEQHLSELLAGGDIRLEDAFSVSSRPDELVLPVAFGAK